MTLEFIYNRLDDVTKQDLISVAANKTFKAMLAEEINVVKEEMFSAQYNDDTVAFTIEFHEIKVKLALLEEIQDLLVRVSDDLINSQSRES